MGDEKTQELLLQLVKDVSYIRAKLDGVEDMKNDLDDAEAQIDMLNQRVADGERTIKSLQHRCDTVEEWLRGNMKDQSNTGWKIIGAVALAVLSAVLGFFIG